ncbi:glycosyltransferase [Butyrivibrio sp. NC3005]|uniref:glycosyltransferase n=1 Tax=Butyrivibrio sp. NC3005 TaxID=1280685 RepID=UPI000400FFDA|nr:glycosyltransferase [Butyrivibrio sp. NC3005]
MNFSKAVVIYKISDEDVLYLTRDAEMFSKVYIYDNSPEVTPQSLKENFKEFNNIVYIEDENNNGLANAYNVVIERAIKDKMDFLMLMDQDSDLDLLSVELLQNFCLYKDIRRIALVCPFVQDWDGKFDNKKSKKVFWAINSGTVLNLKIIEKEQLRYDLNYFVDRTDLDFCKQVKRKHYEIWKVGGTHLHQKVGYLVNGQAVHSPIRHYYMERNRLYYNYKFYSLPIRWMLNVLESARHYYYICMTDPNNKYENKKMFKRGIMDYFKGITGKV